MCGTCGTYTELMAAVEQDLPDVVVTDIRMPPTETDEGIRAAVEIGRDHPEVGVVVLSQHVEAAYAMALLGAGSKGRAYILKDRSEDVMFAAIRAVAVGGSYVDPDVVDAMIATKRSGRNALAQLSPRELEVLGEVATGLSNAAIAGRLFIGERAVEKHINSIFAKLGLTSEPEVHRRVKAVLIYLHGPD